MGFNKPDIYTRFDEINIKKLRNIYFVSSQTYEGLLIRQAIGYLLTRINFYVMLEKLAPLGNIRPRY
jgi:hypothetical protein